MIRDIAGRHNESVKLAVKLQTKKYRRERGFFVAEGWTCWRPQSRRASFRWRFWYARTFWAVYRRSCTGGGRDDLSIGVCSAETLAHASSLGGAADVVSIFESDEWALADLDLAARTNVYLFGVGDPGNVGTLVRSAVAFGVTGLLCSPGTADPFSPKALRAGMGAQFHARIVTEVIRDGPGLQAERGRGRGEEAP